MWNIQLQTCSRKTLIVNREPEVRWRGVARTNHKPVSSRSDNKHFTRVALFLVLLFCIAYRLKKHRPVFAQQNEYFTFTFCPCNIILSYVLLGHVSSMHHPAPTPSSNEFPSSHCITFSCVVLRCVALNWETGSAHSAHSWAKLIVVTNQIPRGFHFWSSLLV